MQASFLHILSFKHEYFRKRRTVLYYSKKSSKKTISAKDSGNAKVVLQNKCAGNIDKIPKNRHSQTDKRESLVESRSGLFAESLACAGNQTLYDSSRIEFLDPQAAKPSTSKSYIIYIYMPFCIFIYFIEIYPSDMK